MLRRFSRFIAIPLMFLFTMTSCYQYPPPRHVRYVSPSLQGGGQQVAQGENGYSQDLFDLEAALNLWRTNMVHDLPSFEAKINDPESKIVNLDLDGDGSIDYVGLEEDPNQSGHFFFMLSPSSKKGDPVKIAEATIKMVGDQFSVEGGYTSVFSGWNDPNAYYRYSAPRMSLGDALFFTWLMTPSRAYYGYHPYGYGWSSRPVHSREVMQTSRTTLRTQMRVSPIQKSAPPANYAKTAATKMPSGYAAPPPAQGIAGKAGQMRDFKVTAPNAQQPKFGGFNNGMPGATKQTAPSAPAYHSSPAPAPHVSAPSAPRSYSPAPSASRGGGFGGGGGRRR